MSDIKVIKVMSDDLFHTKLSNLMTYWNNAPEEFHDIVMTLRCNDESFSDVFKSQDLVNQMQYGLCKVSINKAKKYNEYKNESYYEELIEILENRFVVKGEKIYELKSVLDEYKQLENKPLELTQLFNFIEQYCVMVNVYSSNYNIDLIDLNPGFQTISEITNSLISKFHELNIKNETFYFLNSINNIVKEGK